MRFLSKLAAAAAFTGFASADALVAAAGPLVQVSAFNAGPTKAGMYVYVPTKKTTPAPIIVAIHYCTGTAQKYFSGSNYASLADTHGFIVIYPNSPSSGGCWDVASTGSLSHNKVVIARPSSTWLNTQSRTMEVMRIESSRQDLALEL